MPRFGAGIEQTLAQRSGQGARRVGRVVLLRVEVGQPEAVGHVVIELHAPDDVGQRRLVEELEVVAGAAESFVAAASQAFIQNDPFSFAQRKGFDGISN